jgi:hypothetical protein
LCHDAIARQASIRILEEIKSGKILQLSSSPEISSSPKFVSSSPDDVAQPQPQPQRTTEPTRAAEAKEKEKEKEREREKADKVPPDALLKRCLDYACSCLPTSVTEHRTGQQPNQPR